MNIKHYLWMSMGLIGLGAIATPVYAADQIIEIKGTVSIQRHLSTQYQTASVGTPINLGDLIRPATGAQVKVRCANDSIWSVPAGVVSGLGAGCPESVGTSRSLAGRGSDDFLAFLDQSFVAGTQVLEALPLLRWESVPGTTQYYIQVKDGNTLLWETTVSEPVVRYSGEPLQANQDYQLFVISTNAQQTKKNSNLLFRLIESEQVNTIQITRNRLKAQDLSHEAKAIALVALYQDAAQSNTDPLANRGLLLEAISPLEELVTQGNQTPYIHRLLGDLYLQVGWFGLAEQRYQSAIEWARLPQDRSDRAAAQVGLATVAAARQDLPAAKRWLQRAKRRYQRLQESDRVEVIEQWIEKLQ
jgi:hypothetical protein